MIRDHRHRAYSSLEDMCNKYNIHPGVFKYRLFSGWSMAEALEISENDILNDRYYLGLNNKKFHSFYDVCNAYGLDKNKFKATLESYSYKDICQNLNSLFKLQNDTLLKSNIQGGSYEDHLGNKYISVANMCKVYKVPVSVYLYRVNLGYSIGDALTIPATGLEEIESLGLTIIGAWELYGKPYGISFSTYSISIQNGALIEDLEGGIVVTDHLGIGYKSHLEMCNTWGISYEYYTKIRSAEGLSSQEAILRCLEKSKKVEDHKGRLYATQCDMCKAWDVNYLTYSKLKHRDRLSSQEALVKCIELNHRIKDHTGKYYKTYRDMCKAWNISYDSYIVIKQKQKLSDIDALLKCIKLKYKVVDHKGKVYKSQREMCESWGVNYSSYIGYKRRYKLDSVNALVMCLNKRNRSIMKEDEIAYIEM